MNAIDLWESYRDKVYQDGLGLNQERECSRAFYSGMHCAIMAMLSISNEVSDEELAGERVEEFQESILSAAEGTI